MPVGVVEPGVLGLTVAVRVTGWPGIVVAALEVSAVKLSDGAVSTVPPTSKVSPTAEMGLPLVLVTRSPELLTLRVLLPGLVAVPRLAVLPVYRNGWLGRGCG